jgi:hypothetical protein
MIGASGVDSERDIDAYSISDWCDEDADEVVDEDVLVDVGVVAIDDMCLDSSDKC